MGNIIETLIRYVFDRRQNANIASRSRTDHPERVPSDQLSTNKNTKDKSRLSSSSSSMITKEAEITSTVTMTRISIKETTPLELSTLVTTSEIREIATIINDVTILSNECSKFYIACRTNNIDQVKIFLQTISLDEIDQIEANGSTALHSACYHGHEQIVELLLKTGADRSLLNKFGYLPFDEAKNDKIKDLFLRIPNTNRLVSNTGAIEWELIDNDALETAIEERNIIESLYNNTTTFTTIRKMFEKIEKNYINKGLTYFDGIDKIKRFFRKATEEEDPQWIIKAYTAETPFYEVLNTDIAGGATKYQNERRYIIALLWHHPKLDEFIYTGPSYRVMQITLDNLEKYQIDSLVMTKSFLSSSIDRKIAELFLYRKEAANEQIKPLIRMTVNETIIKLWIICVYHIKYQRSALHVENISQYTNEGEILIMPYTVFKVKRINHIQPSTLLIDQKMTEIQFEECNQFSHTQIDKTFHIHL